MTTAPNPMPGSLASQPSAPAAWSATRPLYWSIRRELWEYRSIYIAPLAVGALFLFGFLLSMFRWPHRMAALATLDPAKQAMEIAMPYNFVALLLMATYLLVAVFYCLDALHGERRDRSILFWKSMPVSDLTTVLSKTAIPLLVLPLLAFVITTILQWMMLFISSSVLIGRGMSAALLWQDLPMFETSSGLFFHLFAVHALYYAPFYGWLILVSAWARRAPFLWAALPPLAVGVVERIAFGTSYFATMLGDRAGGGSGSAPYPAGGEAPIHSFMLHDVSGFFFSPGLWVGLALTAAFLYAAVRLRRSQGPI